MCALSQLGSVSFLQEKPITDGQPLANVYLSLLALHGKSFSLQGLDFAPLPLANRSDSLVAFLRLGTCSGILVILNLGTQPCQVNLSQLGFPSSAKVLFSTRSESQTEMDMEKLRLAAHQAILLRVLSGHGQG